MWEKVKASGESMRGWCETMRKNMYRKCLVFLSSFELWWKLIAEIFKSVIEIIRNPSFIMFSTIAIGLGTMGIWISFFPGAGIDSSENGSESSLVQKIDNLSVFTFCIATLGSVATDYFFEEKNCQNKQQNIKAQRYHRKPLCQDDIAELIPYHHHKTHKLMDVYLRPL